MIWKTRIYVLPLHSGSVEMHFRFFVLFCPSLQDKLYCGVKQVKLPFNSYCFEDQNK